MLDLNSITEYLGKTISSKRYTHSINVSKTAKKLAEFYGYDAFKAEIAGLVHDCARDLEKPLQLKYLKEEGIEADELTLSIGELLHGPAAVHICRKVFAIEDEEILSAVRYHTTGKENMSLLEKIIYLSDFIEPARSFPGVEELRGLAFRNLDKALLLAFNSSILYILSKNGFVHIDTILARNHLLKEAEENGMQCHDSSM
ncbi:MAG TPA: bis(5'-nucleosyl)-tetraphosphatase (symmetrical) YqeK [Bacillota bacterium]|nr:bis(5'-nucleosyl)-tetraphosphatase (symmetrical) YqeK [Bacillota bacterium]HQE65577.1 bis(5'-nucleosyl)-tetraphosphatase (symmetrical) YqeK [Bacillota bacterium]HQJ38021.1 bis(5'-nucleosyl)-tetraphosphatase (symmetrical) YqeK [Bacillota bacterium]HQL36020.1 bis(5'-nucleosyl)-tetraphosphatase (symmetrical) YqeK [Bacillota bacterium]